MTTKKRSISAILGLFLAVFVAIAAPSARAGGAEFSPPERQMECEALIPADLEPVSGWKMLRAEDRLRVSQLHFERRAQLQRRPTLLCRDTGSSKVLPEFVVSQWWWKPIKGAR